jgi:2-keto-4-pentenoate hydratase/2-oxohepta-3-ene-1,7-dioic acid hydratase in catechol pathway
MQEASTADMLLSVYELIAELSRGTTLLKGTLLLTGTPEGVGVARQPQRFLRDGDEVIVQIEGVGRLQNTVRS